MTWEFIAIAIGASAALGLTYAYLQRKRSPYEQRAKDELRNGSLRGR